VKSQNFMGRIKNVLEDQQIVVTTRREVGFWIFKLCHLLVGARDLRTLWSPLVSLNQEGHTKVQNNLFFLKKKIPNENIHGEASFYVFSVFILCLFSFWYFCLFKKRSKYIWTDRDFLFFFFIFVNLREGEKDPTKKIQKKKKKKQIRPDGRRFLNF